MPMHFKDRNTTNQALADAGLAPTIDSVDQLEDDMNAFRPRLSLDHEIAVHATLIEDGLPAARHLLTTIKEIRSPGQARQKATMTPADDFDFLGRQFAAAARTAAMQPGASQAQIMKWAQSVIAKLVPVQGRATLADSGDQSVLPTAQKAAQPNLKDLINNALDTMKEIH